MKYYGYIRVSTSTQVEKGQGLDTQRNAIVEHCKKNNIELLNIFSDEGVSGTLTDRDGLNDLLSSISHDDVVIVLNTSRLWRSDTVKVLVQHEFKKDNVKICSIEQPNYDMYTKDPNDFLFNGMMELLDQYERMSISKKLAKGRVTKARNGSKASGNTPFGYKWDDKHVVIDYNNHLIIQDIFALYAKHKSLAQVQRITIEKGYKTSTGKDFSKQAIKNIIENDFYIGVVRHAGKEYQGEHEPIISKELFKKVNK